MPSWRNKPKSEKGNYDKRRTYDQGKAEIDGAHKMTFRLYGDVLRLWRRCAQRRCLGDPQHCFGRSWPFVPPSQRLRAQKQVIAGGPRRVPLASHAEWTVRRTEIKDLVSWIFG
jgi:hypothetical protein